MAYCQASAAPVGRFLLDLHGESRDLWPGADALCAALQIINHLQDCGTDFCQLDRIYIPQDMLAPARAEPAMLGAPRATPELRCALDQGLDGVEALLSRAAPLAAAIADPRLGLEVAVLHALARRLTARLRAGDPLAGGGRLARPAMAAVAAGALARAALGRAWAPKV